MLCLYISGGGWCAASVSMSSSVHYIYRHMPCLVAIIGCTHVDHIINYTKYMSFLDAIVDYAHAGSATASFKDLITVAQENTASQTEDVLVGISNNLL